MHSAAGVGSGYHRGGQRGLLARRLIEAGHLTTDLALLRMTAREMLEQVLSCREGMTQSGIVARVAGTAIDSDAFLADMADDDFLKCLSKDCIEQASGELKIQPRNTAKQMRAALIEQVGADIYVLPAARFALSDDELAELQGRIEEDEAAPDSDDDDEVSEDDATEDPDDDAATCPAVESLDAPTRAASDHVTV